MKIEKVLAEQLQSEDLKKKASAIIRQLDGLTIAEAGWILHVCGQVLDQCEIKAE